MKTAFTTSILIALLTLALASCKPKQMGVGAIGLPYEIAVTAPPAVWEDSVGTTLQNELEIAVIGLPQIEPSMRVMYVKPDAFDGMMKQLRNVLIVDVDGTKYTKVSLKQEKDKWANRQLVIQLTAPSNEALNTYLHENSRQLANLYTEAEMMRMGNVYRESFSSMVMEKVENRFGVRINAPAEMTFFKDTTNFFWTSNNANSGRMDLVVYTFPYTDPATFTADYLIRMRDSILGANIPGTYPGSRMATNREFTRYEETALNGKYCGRLRGLWHMEGDMMGGPYVSIARLDEANQRIVVAEGFVYAPETDKRSYMRRIEAALYTLLLPGETDPQADNDTHTDNNPTPHNPSK